VHPFFARETTVPYREPLLCMESSTFGQQRDTAWAMSQENVEIVRRLFEAWNADDMDVFRELCDPEVIVRPAEGWAQSGPFVGRQAVMRQWHRLRETFDADAVEPISDFIEAADRVLVRQIWRGVGRGPRSNIELTNVITVRNGRIVYQEFFWDHAEALEAAGLSE
jgi:ketosteroid isomerase-like protein